MRSIAVSIYILGLVAASALAQGNQFSFSNIPGAKTATRVVAASSDAMSQYLARDGPIQPAITAIGSLPVRAVEMANIGISKASDALASGAQSMSRSAGDNGQVRMPGLDTLESNMPASIANIGSMMRQGIAKKNQFIMGQAQAGIQAGDRLRGMMEGSVKGMMGLKMNRMGGMGDMMGSAQASMMKGGQEIEKQLKQSLQGHLQRLQSVHSMGGNMMNSAQQIGQTLGQGVTQAVSQIQRTGQQVKGQLRNSLSQNTKIMSGMMDSMHGSMGNMGQNMQKNLQSLVGGVQGALANIASKPMEIAQSLAQMATKGGSSGGAGKY